MIKINLLPRELRKGRRVVLLPQRELLYLIVGIFCLLLVLYGTWQYQRIKLNKLASEVAMAQEEIQRLHHKVNMVDEITSLKIGLIQRMSAIEILDSHRTQWIRLLEDISIRLPEYLWLTSLKETSTGEGLAMSIEGMAYSLHSLAAFIIRMGNSAFFQDVVLKQVKKSEVQRQKVFSFSLETTLIGFDYHSVTAQNVSTP